MRGTGRENGNAERELGEPRGANLERQIFENDIVVFEFWVPFAEARETQRSSSLTEGARYVESRGAKWEIRSKSGQRKRRRRC